MNLHVKCWLRTRNRQQPYAKITNHHPTLDKIDILRTIHVLLFLWRTAECWCLRIAVAIAEPTDQFVNVAKNFDGSSQKY
jgi:hypothetical protein